MILYVWVGKREKLNTDFGQLLFLFAQLVLPPAPAPQQKQHHQDNHHRLVVLMLQQLLHFITLHILCHLVFQENVVVVIHCFRLKLVHSLVQQNHLIIYSALTEPLCKLKKKVLKFLFFPKS